MDKPYEVLKNQKTVKILIIRLKPVGDTILISPVFRNLKKLFPNATIDVVIYPFVLDMIKHNPYVDNVIVVNRTFFGRLVYYLKCFTYRYDVIIDYINNPVSINIALLTRAKYRFGNAIPRNFFFSHRNTKKLVAYSAIRCLKLLEPLGLTDFDDYRPELFISDDDKQRADSYIDKNCDTSKPIIGIFASSKYQKRLYSPHYFARVAMMITERHNVTALFLFGKDDFEIFDIIHEEIKQNERIVLGQTDTPLGELSGQIARLSFMFSCDTGPKHIAHALDIPTLTIYKATNYLIWNPPDLDRFPVMVAERDSSGKSIDPDPSDVVLKFEETANKLGLHF